MADDYQPIVDERIVGFENKDGRDWLVIERKGRRGRIPAERAQEFMDKTGLSYDASAGEKIEAFASGAGDVASMGQREKVAAAKELKGPAAEAGGAAGRALAGAAAPLTFGLTGIPQVSSAAESLGKWVGAKIGGESTDPYERAKERGVLEAAKTESKAPGYATAGRVTTGLATGALAGMAGAPAGAAMTARGLAGGTGLGARALASGGRLVSSGVPAAVGESMIYTAGKEDLGSEGAAGRIAAMGALTGGLGLAGKAVGDALPLLRAAKAKKELAPLAKAKDVAEEALATAKKSQAVANQKLAAATRMAQAAEAGADEAAKLRARQDVIRIKADLDSVTPAQIAELEKELADVERMIGVQKSALHLTRERAAARPAANKPLKEAEVIGPYDAADLDAAIRSPYDEGPVFAGRPEGTGAQTPRAKAMASMKRPLESVDEVVERPLVSATGDTQAKPMLPADQARGALAGARGMLEGTEPWGPPPPALLAALERRGLSWPSARPPAEKRGNLFRMAANVLDEDSGVQLTRMEGMEPKPKVQFRKGGEGYPKAPPIKTNAGKPSAKAAQALDEPMPPAGKMADEATDVVPDPTPDDIGKAGLEVAESRTAEMERQLGDADALAARLRRDLADKRKRLGSKFEKTVVANQDDLVNVAEGRAAAGELDDLAKSRKAAAGRVQQEAASAAVDADLRVASAEKAAEGPRKAFQDKRTLSEDSIRALDKWDSRIAEWATNDKTDRGLLNTAAFLGTGMAATGNPFAIAAATPLIVAATGAKVARWKPEVIVGALRGIGQLEPALKAAMQASKSAGGLDPQEIVRQHEKRMKEDPDYRKRMIGEAKRLEREFEKQKAEEKGGGGVAEWFRRNGRRVTSTKRSKAENARTKGASKTSKHLTGNAVDIGASDKSSPEAAVKDLVMAHAELSSDPEIMKQVKRVVLEIPKDAKYQHVTVPEEDGLIVRRRNVNGPHLHIETM